MRFILIVIDAFVSKLYHSLLLGNRALWTPLKLLLEGMSPQEQRLYFDSMLRDLSRKYLRRDSGVGLEDDDKPHVKHNIEGVAAMLAALVQNNAVLDEHLMQWLISATGDYASIGLDTRRAVIATFALRNGRYSTGVMAFLTVDTDKLRTIFEKCIEGFGDKLQIQHNPILQQECKSSK
jgi:hypothetical protein